MLPACQAARLLVLPPHAASCCSGDIWHAHCQDNWPDLITLMAFLCDVAATHSCSCSCNDNSIIKLHTHTHADRQRKGYLNMRHVVYILMWNVERKSGARSITCSNSRIDSLPSPSTSASSITLSAICWCSSGLSSFLVIVVRQDMRSACPMKPSWSKSAKSCQTCISTPGNICLHTPAHSHTHTHAQRGTHSPGIIKVDIFMHKSQLMCAKLTYRAYSYGAPPSPTLSVHVCECA